MITRSWKSISSSITAYFAKLDKKHVSLHCIHSIISQIKSYNPKIICCLGIGDNMYQLYVVFLITLIFKVQIYVYDPKLGWRIKAEIYKFNKINNTKIVITKSELQDKLLFILFQTPISFNWHLADIVEKSKFDIAFICNMKFNTCRNNPYWKNLNMFYNEKSYRQRLYDHIGLYYFISQKTKILKKSAQPRVKCTLSTAGYAEM
jgi:hypothetical protein